MADMISTGRSAVTGRELNLPDLALIFFIIVGGLLVWNPLHIGVHDAPDPVTYEANAIPMTYVDQCGDEPVCVWWWQYDETGMPGWRLYHGPDFPADARPAQSLPVLAVGP
jgi:hypothetical protein